jgi:hypothetical protein
VAAKQKQVKEGKFVSFSFSRMMIVLEMLFRTDLGDCGY